MYYVKYQDQQLPIYFDYSVIKNIKQQFNIDLSSGDEKLSSWLADFDNQEKLIFEMLRRGHKKEGKELLFSLSDMVDLMSEDHFFADCMTTYVKCTSAFMTPSSPDQKKSS